MATEIQKVAVLGSGVMGSQIAAHLANAGIVVTLYDINQEIAETNTAKLIKQKPAAYFVPSLSRSVSPRNYDDHIEELAQADWIVEAIVERMDIKKKLYEQIAPHLNDHVILSSNTSGLSLAEMVSVLPERMHSRFLITHFFNPPRYMHLLEVVSGADTREDVVTKIVEFCENRLGKGIVYAKDTPSFVANRIGTFNMMATLDLARKMNLPIEIIDALTGPVLGRPKSATYRTADVVGLDTLALVAQTNYDKCVDDESREIFEIPDYMQDMIERKWLGKKTGQGFYKKDGRTIHALDLATMEYYPVEKVKLASLEEVKKATSLDAGMKTLTNTEGPAGQFAWELLSATLIYSAARLPEVADDIINVDNALRWGFGWQMGPFEIWDAVDVPESVERMVNEGKNVPQWVVQMLNNGRNSFYASESGDKTYYDFNQNAPTALIPHPKTTDLTLIKEMPGRFITGNEDASIIDLGDGVGCVEFHSSLQPSLNPIGPALMDILAEALSRAEQGQFRAIVIANQSANFSAGANLAMILEACKTQSWDQIDMLSTRLQNLTQHIKYAPIPVVAAPFNLTLGGGLEIAMAADRICSSAELYCGLVEVGVGLIPAGGGVLRVLTNFLRMMQKKRTGPFPPIQKAFESIGLAKVTTSAADGLKLGYLNRSDRTSMNPNHLIHAAKQMALAMSLKYEPPVPFEGLILPGEGGRVAIEVNLDNMVKQGIASEHDRLIGSKLANILSGGSTTTPAAPVDEQLILDLEREAFVQLCQEPKTQERILHMLKTGKPLRN